MTAMGQIQWGTVATIALGVVGGVLLLGIVGKIAR